MRQESMRKKDPAEKAIRDIRRKTRRRHSTEEKIRIVILSAPVNWPSLNVSAWPAFGPSGRWFPGLAGGSPKHCVV